MDRDRQYLSAWYIGIHKIADSIEDEQLKQAVERMAFILLATETYFSPEDHNPNVAAVSVILSALMEYQND